METKRFLQSILCSSLLVVGMECYTQNFTLVSGPIVSDDAESIACAWGDFDNDGDEDLFISNGITSGRNNILFINEGAENNYEFVPVTGLNIVEDGAASRAASWGDFDNDGDLDLFVANQNNPKYNNLYQNNGDGTFTRVDEGEIVTDSDEADPAGWIDYNNDGFLDAFVGNPIEPNCLYHNNGDWTFSRIVDGPIAKDTKTGKHSWGDFDNDGDPDLLISYFLKTTGALFVNNGEGDFIKISNGMVLNDSLDPMCSGEWLDYDNDGDWDIIVVGHAIYRNEGPENDYKFRKLQSGEMINSPDPIDNLSSWADIDNDGDLDCFIANLNTSLKNSLYINNGNGSFTRNTSSALAGDAFWSLGSAWADYDNDGDMDVYICNNAENNLFYKNTNNNGNSWLKVKLIGSISNAAALGAIIKLKTTTDTDTLWQMRAIEGQSSFLGQNSLIAHFGLGKAEVVDSIVVLWPSGLDTVLTEIDINQLITLTEKFPGGFLRANFKADLRNGSTALEVQFTDLSLSDPDNPITSWSWDLDGDGIEDSDKQIPDEFPYTSAEQKSYTVSLTVTSSAGSNTITREDYIQLSGPESIAEHAVNPMIKMYPIPVIDNLTIDFGSRAMPESLIELMDISGKIVYKSTLEDSDLNHTIDLQLFGEGLYLIRISNNKYTFTEKVLKK